MNAAEFRHVNHVTECGWDFRSITHITIKLTTPSLIRVGERERERERESERESDSLKCADRSIAMCKEID